MDEPQPIVSPRLEVAINLLGSSSAALISRFVCHPIGSSHSIYPLPISVFNLL